jgi:hypothetical protein
MFPIEQNVPTGLRRPGALEAWMPRLGRGKVQTQDLAWSIINACVQKTNPVFSPSPTRSHRHGVDIVAPPTQSDSSSLWVH